MTEDELVVMEHLWKRGVPTAKIAEHLGYTQSNVLVTAFRNRDRFPKRYLSDVEIVRCIDCVWFQEFPGTCGPKSACTLYPTFYHFTAEYGYCDNGVRKVRE